MTDSPSSNKIKFGKINHFLLIGGGRLMTKLAFYLKDNGYTVTVFSAKRHITEIVQDDGTTLEQLLDLHNIPLRSPDNINNDELFLALGAANGIGLGFGETWTFTRKTVDLFNGRLIDYMGIRLPQYRGGAHYTWQILRHNRVGACNLQLINEEMVQGNFDSGQILKSKEYLFSPSARKPKVYTEEALQQGLDFMIEFLREIKDGKAFSLNDVPEQYSIYFPRLHTKSHAFIDWSWNTGEIEAFICAFDDPYPGASTFINGKRVFFKNCHVEYNDGHFHPFQTGLIYRINSIGVYISTRQGTLIVQDILDEDGNNESGTLNIGDRFFTPRSVIEEAMMFRAEYDGEGLTQKK